jgi:flagellar protein FlaG
MLLVTGVVAAAILIVAVLPVIWSMVGTFGSASAATDRSMRTDFKIVTTYAKWSSTGGSGANVTVWMKNLGTTRIGTSELKMADVYVGKSSDFKRATWYSSPQNRVDLSWWYILNDLTGGTTNVWDPGETLEIDAFCSSVSASGQPVYFQFTLPSAVSRSAEFTAS